MPILPVYLSACPSVRLKLPLECQDAVDEAPRKEEKWETDTRMIIDFLWLGM